MRCRSGTVVLGMILAISSAEAGQISCAKSSVDFDRSVFPGHYDFVCKREEIVSGPATGGTGDQAVVDRAFAPPDSVVSGVLMSGGAGRNGSAYFIVAHEGTSFGEPQLRSAIESKVRLFGDRAGSVAWEDQRHIGDYDVDFFQLNLPQTGSMGGARQCMGFVRYVDGNATNHMQRVIGSYCEAGTEPFDSEKVTKVLGAVIVRLSPQ